MTSFEKEFYRLVDNYIDSHTFSDSNTKESIRVAAKISYKKDPLILREIKKIHSNPKKNELEIFATKIGQDICDRFKYAHNRGENFGNHFIVCLFLFIKQPNH